MTACVTGCATVCVVAIGCDDGIQPPGPYVALQELDQTQQPTTAPVGVLVDVVASGGNVVRLEVFGGLFANSNTSSLCINFPGPGIHATVVSVLPTQTEALVNAYLGNRTAVNAGGTAPLTGSDSGAPGADSAPRGDGSPIVSDAAAGGGSSDAQGSAIGTLPSGAPLPPFDPSCLQTNFAAEDVSASMVVSLGRAPAGLVSPREAGSGNEAEASEVDGAVAADADAGGAETSGDGAADVAEEIVEGGVREGGAE